MEKEALIDIILNDIKEIETLVRTFKGKNAISPAFLNLTKKKLANLTEELSLLEGLDDVAPIAAIPTPELSESSLTSSASTPEAIIDGERIAASSDHFFQEEATETPKKLSHPAQKIEKKEGMSLPTDASQTSVNTTNQAEDAVLEPTPSAPVITTEQPKQAQPTKTTKEPGILGEQIGKDKTSVYERVTTQTDQTDSIKQIGKPVNDIRKAFGLNDRFYYQRELFNGNPELFNQTLDQINQMDSYDSAAHFLKSNFHWTEDNDVAGSFLKSVKRRFI